MSKNTLIDTIAKQQRSFGSGYEREHCWRELKRAELNERDLSRLEALSLKLIANGVNREFWYMCRTMAKIASDDYWEAICVLANRTRDARLPHWKDVSVAACYLLIAKHNLDARGFWMERRWKFRTDGVRLAFERAKREPQLLPILQGALG